MYKKSDAKLNLKFQSNYENIIYKNFYIFSLILLNSCDKPYLDLTKKNNSLKKNLFIYLVMKRLLG